MSSPATLEPVSVRAHAPPGSAPAMPYATVDAPFGMGDRTRPYKVRPDNPHGEFLTDDEAAVLAYVRWLEGERDRLAAWKMEEMEAVGQCDLQAVAKVLGITPGASIYKELQPAVERLLTRVAELETAGDAAAMAQGAAEGIADAAKGGGKWKKPK